MRRALLLGFSLAASTGCAPRRSRWTRPSDVAIERLRERMERAQLTSPEIGASRGEDLPDGSPQDRHELPDARGLKATLSTK